jgi:hypothetical protein
MKTGTETSIIPENKVGKALDIEKTVRAKTIEEAHVTYQRACVRLLNPALWVEIAGPGSSSFKLVPQSYSDTRRLARVNDYFQIDIPGPGSSTGDGYDWVKVDRVEENPDKSSDESFGMRLKTGHNPEKEEEGIAHFFGDSATSTFIIKRNGNRVTASYHGRNEKPNIKNAKLIDKIRNLLVAWGAMSGFSKVQWTALLKGLLQK